MTSSLPAPAATDRPGEEGNGRRTRVHAVCAPPYGRNPGMSTVDLGLARVAEHLGPDVDVRCWRLWDDGEWRKPAGRTRVVGPALVNDVDSGLDYSLVRGREDELADCDVLLYWGDFHHMAPYQRSTVEVLTSELAAPLDPIEAAAVARRVLLQEGADADLRSRTLSYGTTLSLNAAEDYRGDYGDLLGGFVRGARQVWFRDPYSAGVAGTLRGDAAGHHGVDAAVLAGVLPHTPGNGGLEVFLGRSSVLPEEVALLGRPWPARPAPTRSGCRGARGRPSPRSVCGRASVGRGARPRPRPTRSCRCPSCWTACATPRSS